MQSRVDVGSGVPQGRRCRLSDMTADKGVSLMKAIVVYESLWGNTASIARAIADGIGPQAEALTTDAASPETVAEAELIVAGAPVLGFSLPSDQIRNSIAQSEADAPAPPDLAHPSMRSWLESMPRGSGRAGRVRDEDLVVPTWSNRRHREALRASRVPSRRQGTEVRGDGQMRTPAGGRD